MTIREHLAALELLVAPPATPFRAPCDWAAFERANDFLPPSDYRALLDTYGSGTFECAIGRLVLDQPEHPKRTFLEGNRWLRDNFRHFQRMEPERNPTWSVYPEPGGYLPFAVDDTSLSFGWLTAGEPDAWTVAIEGTRDAWWSELPFGALELALRWSQGRVEVDQRPSVLPGGTFLARTEDAFWSGRSGYASIEFAPGASARMLVDNGAAWVRSRVEPASVSAVGAQGDARTPLHASLTIWFDPREEGAVIEAVRRLAAELATPVASVEALDGSPIWAQLTGNSGLRLVDPSDG